MPQHLKPVAKYFTKYRVAGGGVIASKCQLMGNFHCLQNQKLYTDTALTVEKPKVKFESVSNSKKKNFPSLIENNQLTSSEATRAAVLIAT